MNTLPGTRFLLLSLLGPTACGSGPAGDTASRDRSHVLRAVAQADAYEGNIPFSVAFSAAGSRIDGTLEEALWEFGDGQAATGRSVTHTYLGSGQLQATLTLWDDLGQQSSDTLELTVHPQDCPTAGTAQVWGTVETSEAIEISGVVESRKNEGVLWVHNDAGNAEVLYAMSRDGRHLGSYELVERHGGDWEDLATAPDPDTGEYYLFIGDVGDNSENRDYIIVYRVPEPDVDLDQEPVEEYIGGDAILLDYPDGRSLNAETIMVDPTNQDIYVVQKDYEGSAGIYRKPAPHYDAERATLELVVELDFASSPLSGGATTGGDFSLLGNRIVIRTYGTTAYIWERDASTSMLDTFLAEPCALTLPSEQQGEAITFSVADDGLITISEGEYQPIDFLPFTD